MTIGRLPLPRQKRSRKNKQVFDEHAPLLSRKQDEDVSFDEFDGAFYSGAVFDLSTTIVGAGIMALPATMEVLGLIPGILMIILTAFLTEASIELLLGFSRAEKSVSYGGLMGEAFGKIGGMALQICVVVNNVGVLIVYMIIIGDILFATSSSGKHHSVLLKGWFGVHWLTGRFFVLLITTLAIFAPLACFKHIYSLHMNIEHKRCTLSPIGPLLLIMLLSAKLIGCMWYDHTTIFGRGDREGVEDPKGQGKAFFNP